ncbi:MAG: hypothetical protein EBZ14_07700 [Gammaproteobacteria bacterium]|nr:hypothetical protein [Gammaproteobacteria bacterium]NDA15118.1 hypothetical protein [Gammaproteobacteria bacterium]NDG44084.1 hypothetical protein [Gammaproteobacteria bacterium]
MFSQSVAELMIGTKQYKVQLHVTLTTKKGEMFRHPIELVVDADSKELAEAIIKESTITSEVTSISLTAIHHVGRNTTGG